MEKIKAAVVGYGNIGKYVLEALETAPDFEIAGIVRRNGAADCPKELQGYTIVRKITELAKPDVAILCVPSRKTEEYAKEILPLGINTVGERAISPFLAGFTEVDELHRPAAKEAPVECSHAHNAGGLAPVAVILQGGGELHLFLAGNGLCNILIGRIHQAESVVERHKVEHLKVAGGGHQGAVKVIGHTVKIVHLAVELAHRANKIGLKFLILGLEEFYRFIGGKHLHGKRKVLGHQAAHLLTEGHDLLVRYTLTAELAVKAAGKGVVNLELPVREKRTGRPLGQEAQ